MSGDRAPVGEWTVRHPEGYYDAVQATGTMIAPILAGFAFTILVLVLIPPGKGEADPLRWRDPVLALLVLSALLLIISTQAALRARGTFVKPDELRGWYPESVDESGWPNTWLAAHQRSLEARTAQASTACRHTYNAGTLLFFTAITLLLVPSGSVSGERSAVLAAAALAVSVEAAWLTGTSLRQHSRLERLPSVLTPAAYAVAAVVLVLSSSAGAARAAAAVSLAVAAVAAGTAALRLAARGAPGSGRSIGCGALIAVAVTLAAAGCLLDDVSGAAALAVTAMVLLAGTLGTALLPARLVAGPDDADGPRLSRSETGAGAVGVPGSDDQLRADGRNEALWAWRRARHSKRPG